MHFIYEALLFAFIIFLIPVFVGYGVFLLTDSIIIGLIGFGLVTAILFYDPEKK